ncbi:MAG TPA: ribonuclease D [Blastocatellia bacterium]|nr:ribonuclease D [Blastocatellia bacterium]HMV85169.1 ribonuclease D [Blastocatellia bacterium]HMX26149.1 ribonuclease D [Blastocatellia bacterium]HMY71289.1 ribonuclease D [Blastocatellia bacterium]HMZ20268.1 ribonuclease D [Blastocatellia bacterium]
MVDHKVDYVGNQTSLAALIERLKPAPVLALDIETVNWWDRAAERVALVQLAFREEGREDGKIQVAVIDALAELDLNLLRVPLELSLQIKAIHNAGYDAVRLARHFRIFTSPIHDTMLAARRGKEKKCSLQAQVAAHLGILLDKAEQRGDWSRRPLSREQLDYAALDATCTLLLYEKQIRRGLRGDYEVPRRSDAPPARQSALPLSEAFSGGGTLRVPVAPESLDVPALESPVTTELDPAGLALLGIVSELGGRYSPEQLAASVGSERIGVAGWIVDGLIGVDADIDEESAKLGIAALCERGLMQLSLSRRLEATTGGLEFWLRHKPLR